MPIRNRQGEPAGILQLFNKLNGVFTKEDEEFLNAMSLQMALAMENARMHREIVEKKRLEKEMQLARGIQRSLLPEAPPTVPGFDIAVLNVPCFEVGGDYYDFLTLGPNTLLLVVADVEGKGVSSAMVMSNLQATLRALVMHLHSLEVITLSLNEMILADTRQEKYLSCFMGLVDTRRRGLHYINAGHIPPILVRKNGEVLSLEQGGMVIGLFSAVEYERGSMQLMPGDVLLCCTDGIIEASDKDHEEFGADRLVKIVQNNQHLSAQELVKIVAQEVEDYAKGGVHIDDKVLMVVKVLEDLDPDTTPAK
jgi:sigma-B regulation protein RsbU (phosphoserine phosphatase)